MRKLATAAAVLTLGLFGFAARGHSQSADALISKLVQKGILTTDEATALRQESNQDFNKAYAAKTGMADWVNALKFNGDLRMRYNDDFSDNSAYTSRQRFRFRMRFGVIVKLNDDMEVGLRLTSGANNNGLSANQTMEDNGSKKNIYIDQAYGRWSPRLNEDAAFVFTAGKMASPFTFSEMVIDTDYTPEGFAQQFNYTLSQQHSVKLILGEFVLDELSGSANDPFLFAAQVRFDSQWSKHVTTTFGLAALSIMNVSSLSTNNVPNVNSGNRHTTNGSPASSFNPLVADGTFTYLLDSFPSYPGIFPVGVSGEFMWNPATSSHNTAWSAGPTFGKTGKKGTWQVSYRYKNIEGDAWYEELVSDDFGAYYEADSARGLKGFGTGTNVRGHVVRAGYALSDSLTLSLTYLGTELIEASPYGSESGMHRIFVDALWTF